MSHVRRAFACVVALSATLFVFALPSSAVDADDAAAAASAVAWLKTQQQPDGGFERVFPGFETRDATLAIAEQAQTGSTWSTTAARTAVEAVKAGGSGPDPIDYLEHDSAVVGSAGAAAKTIVLTTAPLGLDATSFGSFGSPAAPVNLVDRMGGCSASSDAALNNLLYILLAQRLECGSVSAAGLAEVKSQQQSDGSWKGDEFASLDMDTTALAVETLIAGGFDATDPAVHAALVFFAKQHQANGSWQAFGGDDVNSTSLVSIALRSAGFDPSTPCWRDTIDPSAATIAYTSPGSWIRSQQQPDGRVASQNDIFPPINTFATSQAVEGLHQSWLPIVRLAEQTCSLPPPPVVDTTTPVAGGAVTLSGGGFAPLTELSIELHSTPVVLGTTTTDAFGNYTTTVTIPADTPPGVHQLVVAGLGPDGQLRTVSTEITVLTVLTEAEGATAPQPVSTAPRFTG